MIFLKIKKPEIYFYKNLKKNRKLRKNWSINEIHEILEKYPFKYITIKNSLTGGNSDNILIDTDKGKKVLKKYFWSLDSTIYEHSIHKKLLQNNFPCSALVLNNNGNTFTELKKRHYAIYEFINGYKMTDYIIFKKTKKILIANIGIELSKLHFLMKDYFPKGKKLIGFKTNSNELWRDIAWHLNVLNKFLKNTDKKFETIRDYMTSIKKEFKKSLIESAKYYENNEYKFIKTINHGDYSPQNVLFEGKRISGILDFGDSNENYRIADIARGLSTFCKQGEHGINEELALIFLESYQKIQNLGVQEITAIPDFVRWRYLMNIIWSLFGLMEKHPNRAPNKNMVNKIHFKWKNAVWIKKHTDELIDGLKTAFVKS
jgi:Ser/Thr protein kinase RdoA (MazF antagonist)